MSDLTDQMRAAADTLEAVKQLYGVDYNIPIAIDGSIKWLRNEADYLDRPVPGEAS